MFHAQYTDSRYQSLKLEVMSIFSFGWYLAMRNIIPLLIISIISNLLFVNFIGGSILDYLIHHEIFSTILNSTLSAEERLSFKTLVSFPFISLTFGAVVYIVRSFLSGKIYTFNTLRDSFKFAFTIWLSVFTTQIFVLLITFAGFLLFLIPGILFALWFMFAQVSAAFEELNPKDALKYSKKLVYGRWWKVFWIFVLIMLLVNIAYLYVPNFIGNTLIHFLGLQGFISSFILTCIQILTGVPPLTVMISIFLALQKFPVQPSASTIENSASSAT